MKTSQLTASNLTNLETTEGLQWGIDSNFRRLLDRARDEWERRFAGKDPSNSCVSVRVVAVDAAVGHKHVRSSGFLPSAKNSGKRPPFSGGHLAR